MYVCMYVYMYICIYLCMYVYMYVCMYIIILAIGSEEHDKEGRVITAEFEKYYFITAYVPNAGEKLKRYCWVWLI